MRGLAIFILLVLLNPMAAWAERYLLVPYAVFDGRTSALHQGWVVLVEAMTTPNWTMDSSTN